MRLSNYQPLRFVALCSAVLFACAAYSAQAQQVTYYDFNGPQATPGQTSFACDSYSQGPVAAGILFCLNYAYSPNYPNLASPSFTQDFYPPAIDPNAANDNDAGSTQYAAQMTSSNGGQAASMWFSVPQDVTDGFNVWFAFKITPNSGSYATGDGLAFVVQNSGGSGVDNVGNCTESGSGFTALGSGGGCIGYGAITNSVALELDTYRDSYDPVDIAGSDSDNHIALQSCGLDSSLAPLPNSPAHLGTGNCLVSLGTSSPVSTLISNPTRSAVPSAPVQLADGGVHQMAIVYNGPHDSPANYIYVYLDPAYTPGTHTPVAGSIPLFSGPFDITKYMNLGTGGGNFSPAYVGFTSATGAAFEQHELLAWTFTPHATVTQQQPLNPPGTPTTFNFGTHSYTVNYPAGTQTSGIGMGVIATTISPSDFTTLLGLGATQYTGSACQVYDDTGGNCIIYSTYCYDTSSNQIEACPAPPNPPTDCLSNPSETNCVNLKSAYNNSIQPVSPGYLQGDPLYSPISSIQGSGTVATATCVGECAVTQGQTVTIIGNSSFSGTITVQSVLSANQFTFSSSVASTGNGGFLTSNNVRDIFTSYLPQNIDGSTTGKTQNFSDFVVTAITSVSSQTQLSAATNTPAPNQPDELTATITAPTMGGPGNLLLLLPPSSPGNTVGGTVSFFENSTASPIANCQNVAVLLDGSNYQATCSYTPAQTGTPTILAQYSGDPYHQSSSGNLPLNVLQPTVIVNVGTVPSRLSFSIDGSPYTTPQSLSWNINSSHTLSTSSPQTLASTPNTQYVFSNWSDNTSSPSDTVMAPSSPSSSVNYTAIFTTQYLLTVNAGPGGSVTATNGYYNAQSMQNIAATPSNGYYFSGWTGGGDVANPGSASTTVTMTAPETLTATFSARTTPTIGWSTPAAIVYGTPLGVSQLDASTTVAGAFSYTPAIGTVLTAGPHMLQVTFTPTDTTRYNSANAQVTIQVDRAAPTLSWTPAPLQIGYALTSVQLDASANVPGTFVYSPASGTVITNTRQTLSVTFTPTDSTDYSSVSMSVPLTVTPGPLASVSPGSIDFGTLYLGSVVTKTVRISNTGNAAMSIVDPFIAIVQGGNSTEFITLNLCPRSLAAGTSCLMTVTFVAGPFYNPQMATLTINDNAPGGAQTVPLTATVINPQAHLSTASLNFGRVKVGGSSTSVGVTLTNTGATTLSNISIGVSGGIPGEFPVSSTCTGTLTAGSSCTINISFSPATKGNRSGTLVVTDNARNSPQTISLAGTGS